MNSPIRLSLVPAILGRLVLAIFAGGLLAAFNPADVDAKPPRAIAHAVAATLRAPDAPKGWQHSGPGRLFEGQDLFGHINGGAELYHEFGFADLLVAGYVDSAGQEMELEIYRMSGPRAALGIYLMKCGEETPRVELPYRNSASPYQLSLVAEDRFVQVNSFSGKAELVPDMARLAAAAVEGLSPAETDSLIARLPAEGLKSGSARLLRGRYALEPVYTFGEGYDLGLGGETWAALGRYSNEDGETWTLILVEYGSTDEAAEAYVSLTKAHLKSGELLENRGDWLCWRDFSNRFGDASLAGSELRLRVHLADRPVPGEG